ncbi:hypothetical protein [Spirosoma arcticum]
MKRFKADTLTFPLAESWGEVTLDQYITITDPDAPTSSEFLLTTLTGIPGDDFRPLRAYDLDFTINQHLSFITEPPALPTVPPTKVTIGGKLIKLPADLGAVATVGQMRDVEFVVSSRQKEGEPVDVITMAPVLLPIFLWSSLRTDVYTNRHAAEALWADIGAINCVEGLALSAFFLSSFFKPSPSGRISVETIPQIQTRSWPQRLRRACQRLIRFTWTSNWLRFLAFPTKTSV